MIFQVKCKECSLLLVHIDKDQITKEDLEMYGSNTLCSICSARREQKGLILHKIIAFFHKICRFLGLMK